MLRPDHQTKHVSSFATLTYARRLQIARQNETYLPITSYWRLYELCSRYPAIVRLLAHLAAGCQMVVYTVENAIQAIVLVKIKKLTSIFRNQHGTSTLF